MQQHRRRWLNGILIGSLLHVACPGDGGALAQPERVGWGNVGSTYYDLPVWAPAPQDPLPEEQPLLIVGAGHSWLPPRDGVKALVSSEGHDTPPTLLGTTNLVQVGAGVSLGELLLFLEQRGRSLETFPYHSAITVGGAIATASHGTSFRQGTLSESVAALEVEPDSQLPLEALSASAGRLGLIRSVTLETIPLQRLTKQIDILDTDDFFTSLDAMRTPDTRIEGWYDPETHQTLVVRFHPADQHPPPLPNHPAPSKSLQDIEELVRLPLSGTPRELFLVDNETPRVQAEYAIDLPDGPAAVRGLREWLQERDIELMNPVILRFGGTDRLPLLSPARSDAGTLFLNFDFHPGAYPQILDLEQWMVEKWGARPHLGKFHAERLDHLEAAYGDPYRRFQQLQGSDLRARFGSIHREDAPAP